MLSKNTIITLFILVITALTVPRLFLNYGYDDDSASGVVSAENLLRTGTYVPSRLPGNPLFEYLLAGLAPWGGPAATNTFVLLSFCLAVWAFYRIVKDSENRLLLTIIFASTPIILLNAATTMDYIPGLALLLCAYLMAVEERYTAAFIFTGLAAGMRISNFLFMVPLSVFLLLRRQNAAKIAALFMLGLFTGIVFYLPIITRFGARMFVIPPSVFSFRYTIFRTAYNLIMLFGPVASAGIIVLVLINLKSLGRTVKDMPRIVLDTLSAALFIMLFLRHSDETSYLIPAVPFIYFLLARVFSRKDLIVTALLVFSFSVFNIELKGGQSGSRKLIARPSWGIIAKDYEVRKELNDLRQAIVSYDWPAKAIIMTGVGPTLTYNNKGLEPASIKSILPGLDLAGMGEPEMHKLTGKEVYFVFALPENFAQELKNKGFKLYIFSESAPSTVMNVYKYDPYSIGMQKLDIFCDKPFYGKS